MERRARRKRVQRISALLVSLFEHAAARAAEKAAEEAAAADHGQLIQRLCVLAGTIMEDASVDAVSIVSSHLVERGERLTRLHQAGSDIAALLAAAAVIHLLSLERD